MSNSAHSPAPTGAAVGTSMGASASGQAPALSKAAVLYAWLACSSIACLIIANVVGVKLFDLDLGSFHVIHTAGMLTFPITFLITDLVNEYYGKKAARRIAWVGVAMGLLVFGVIQIADALPSLDAPFNVDERAFEQILSSATGMYLASMAAFLVGSLLDIGLFGWIKRATGGKLVWLRATGSTVISQFIDSFIVTWLAFSVFRAVGGGAGAEPMPFGEVLRTAATGYVLKFVIALALTPAIYAGRWAIRRYVGLTPLPAEGRH